MKSEEDAEQLAQDLLGRSFWDLGPEEQEVLRNVASGTLIGPDADELAQLKASVGDRLADHVAAIGGSWGFIIFFGLVLVGWMLINSEVLGQLGLPPFDGYPYIFLNLILSMLAAIQAPVIMMSQNRQAAKDRISARHDYEVNLRTQLELVRLSRRVDAMGHMILRRLPEPPAKDALHKD